VDRPRIVVTGASGFLGRHLVEALRGEFEIHAVARDSLSRQGAVSPRDVRWHYVDLAESTHVEELADELRRDGSVELVLHFAGYYDFTGQPHADYQRANVDATRNILSAARAWGCRDLIHASSVAACRFPADGTSLDESCPADGPTHYGRSKRDAEQLVDQARGDALRCWVVRFGAVFSDWCEYEPLYRLLETWLLEHPRGRILAGSGASAIPYLHVRDAVSFVQRLLQRRNEIDSRERLLACPGDVTSHRELFAAATACHFGSRLRPLPLPKLICRLGLRARLAAGRLMGRPPFERPWMASYIDRELRVDASRTWTRLGWQPRARFEIRRRMPFLIHNRKASPGEWQRRNRARIAEHRRPANLEIAREIQSRRPAILDEVTAFVLDPLRRERYAELQRLDSNLLRTDGELLLEALVESIRAADQDVFLACSRDLGMRRRAEGIPRPEVAGMLDALSDSIVLALSPVRRDTSWNLALIDHVTMTVQFGLDELHDVYGEAS